MEQHFNKEVLTKVAEVELVYKSKVKASERPVVQSSTDAANILRILWEEGKMELVEQFKVLFLNRSNKVICVYNVSSGGVTGTVADPKLIFTAALKVNAVSVEANMLAAASGIVIMAGGPLDFPNLALVALSIEAL